MARLPPRIGRWVAITGQRDVFASTEVRGRAYCDLAAKAVQHLAEQGNQARATGSSMRAAAAALRPRNPAHMIVAVPVAAPFVCEELAEEVDEVVCTFVPEEFGAVGQWYRDFSQTTDEEVRDLLARAASASLPRAA